MNWIDFSILFVIIVAFLNGYRRGAFKEISTLIGIILSVIFAVLHADWMVDKLHGRFNFSPTVLYMLCYVLLLAACIIILKILGHFFYKLVKIAPLKVPNKITGGCFGILKGLVVLSLIFMLFLFPTPFRSLDNAMESATMAKTIRGIVPIMFNGTTVLHPRSGEFMAEVQNGIYMNGIQANNDSGDSSKKNVLLGMTDDDVKTLDKLNQYYKAKKPEQQQ
jgi:membrane protein required for colicin V production